MRKVLSLTSLLTMLLPCLLHSQEYSYTHYDISDGLAGSTAYCITQDKEGFIWVGTETGVSRFDGTHFRNFTAIDGLPDVEILEMFGDSRGRVWMAPFRKSICYYYKGKIYNQENDSLLHGMHVQNIIYRFAEDSAGNILAAAMTALYLIKADGSIREIDSIAGRPIQDCGAVSTSADGHFLVQAGNGLYKFSGGDFTLFHSITIESSFPVYIAMNRNGLIWRKDSVTTSVHCFSTGKTESIQFSRVRYRHNTFTNLGDSLFCINEDDGVREYNLYNGHIQRLLPGQSVSHTFRDATGNMWFTTLGQGIFRLNSDEFQTIRLGTPNSRSSSAHAITRLGNRLFVGNGQNNLYIFGLPGMSLSNKAAFSKGTKNRIHYIDSIPGGHLYVVSETGIEWLDSDFHFINNDHRIMVKSCFKLKPDKLLIANPSGVLVFDLRKFAAVDTLYRERATTVCRYHDSVFVGTLNGLYGIASDKSVRFLGKDIPFLSNRISALAESADGTLWVASYDAGVIGYRNGRVIARLSKHQGLTSDVCRAILVHDSALWVGTDKGLIRVRLDRPGYPMDHYTAQDGLGADIINTIYADGPVIYVGTSAGLSFFDETRVNVSEGCRLYLLSIQNSGKERIGDSAALVLPYKDKHLRLEFTGISYRSVGDITYQYRLLGLDSVWRTTKETFLEYPTLPSGNYEWQLRATNKFGLKSGLLALPFEVSTPWWQTSWFYALVLVTVSSLIWMLVSLRIRRIRNRQREKEQLNQRMMELEHMALQSQMNPHFIFNCLNSIQQYVFDQEVFAANKYITGFAKLIRATLQNSSRAFILVSEEVGFLSGYLSLEKLRFKEKMDYTIDVDPALKESACLIPPMLIQPYVENSMRHGLRHKVTGKGTIHISFRHGGSRLIVVVEDNGIGRKGAAVFKTREHIEYQSKGMSLTADRIRMINSRYTEPIRVDVIDLEEADGKPVGTRVVIELPLFHSISENETI